MKPEHERAVIRDRVAEYKRGGELSSIRGELVRLWREAYPAAAAEAAWTLRPLIMTAENKNKAHAWEPDEQWFNDIYVVTVRRHKVDPVFGSKGGMIQIGISSLDGTARHDWRDFQAIKSQIAGPETEAFELYPAESRLLDPSNYYSLWCFPSMNRIKVGRGPEDSDVRDADMALAAQRGFVKEADATDH